MKKFFYLIMVMLIAMISVTSCDFLSDDKVVKQEPQYNKSTIPTIEDSIKNRLLRQDSLYNGLIQQIDTLTNALNESNAKVDELKQQVEAKEAPNILWFIAIFVALILGIISIAEMVVSRGVYVRGDELSTFVKNNFKKFINDSGIGNYINQQINSTHHESLASNNNRAHINPNTQSDLNTLYSRIKIIDQKLLKIENDLTNSGVKTFSPSTSIGSKKRYVKAFSANFFMELLLSNSEGCVFEVELTSDTSGEFTYLSIDKLKSKNGLESIVEYEGNCTLDEAKDAKILVKGLCKKTDNDVWEVTKKLKINISK